MKEYPKPATPLPWWRGRGWRILSHSITSETIVADTYQGDAQYIIHAANTFPHLVAALEEALPCLGGAEHALALGALAIARGDLENNK